MVIAALLLVQLVFLNVSNPSNPIFVGTGTTSLGGGLIDINIQGNYLYGINTLGNLFTFDITNPSSPVLVSTLSGLSTNTHFYNVYISIYGRYLFIQGLSAIYIYDIINPLLPVQVFTTTVTGQGNLISSGRYIYMRQITIMERDLAVIRC